MTSPRLIWGVDHPLTRPDCITEKDLWFGDRRLSPVRFDTIRLFSGDLSELNPWLSQGFLAPKAIQSHFFSQLDHYLIMLERSIFGRDCDFSQQRDWLSLVLHGFHGLLDQCRPAYAFFVSPPHFGIDQLLSDLCEWLSIPVYWGYQSLFPDRFWLLTSSFQRITPPYTASIPVLPDVSNEQLFYMQKINVPYRNLASVAGIWLRVLIGKIKGGAAYGLRRVLLQRRFQQQIMAQTQSIDTRETLLAVLNEKPYIYVPMHLQPEMTTTALGGSRFHDQAEMVEALLSILPEGWQILLKENPKQDWQCRSNAFWKRIKADPRVKLLPRHCASKVLIAHSRMVAVISGTAGWEAIRMNKPVISFGWCWYGDLPGVYPWKPDLALMDINLKAPEKTELEDAYCLLVAEAWEGVLDAEYLTISNLASKKEINTINIKMMIHCLDTRNAVKRSIPP